MGEKKAATAVLVLVFKKIAMEWPAELFLRLFQELCLALRSPAMIAFVGVSRRTSRLAV